MNRIEQDNVNAGMDMTDEQYRAALRQFARADEQEHDQGAEPDQMRLSLRTEE